MSALQKSLHPDEKYKAGKLGASLWKIGLVVAGNASPNHRSSRPRSNTAFRCFSQSASAIPISRGRWADGSQSSESWRPMAS